MKGAANIMITIKKEDALSLIVSMFEYAQFVIERLFRFIVFFTAVNSLLSVVLLSIYGWKMLSWVICSILIVGLSIGTRILFGKVVMVQKAKVIDDIMHELDRIEVEQVIDEIDE